MAEETVVTTMNDQRRFARVPFTGAVTYRYEPECEGTAMCADVSRGGMCLHLGRYLRPGKHVMLDAVALDGEPIELKAHVAWCRAISGSHTFATGVRVYHDEPLSMSALTAMVHEGLEQSGVFGELRTLHAARVAQMPEEPSKEGTDASGARGSGRRRLCPFSCGVRRSGVSGSGAVPESTYPDQPGSAFETRITIDLGHAVAAGVVTMATAPSV